MESEVKQLLDKATSAMVAAIEIYNKPGFPYRAESFAILAINGWELLVKAKWLDQNNNDVQSLYVRDNKGVTKMSRSNTPLTHSMDYVAKKLVEAKTLDRAAWQNIELLLELRDCATHFPVPSPEFQTRLYGISTACVRNFAIALRDWFGVDLSQFDLNLMPLAFMNLPDNSEGIVANTAEKNFLELLENIEMPEGAFESPYAVTIDIDIHFIRNNKNNVSALPVRVTNDPTATPIRLTDEDVFERFPYDYKKLTHDCKERYQDFKMNCYFHNIHRMLKEDSRFSITRLLDPSNPKSAKKTRYNGNIFKELDKYFTRK